MLRDFSAYDKLRTYGGHEWDFEGISKELFRVICHGGIVCWNVGDSVVDGSETLTSFKQAIFFKEQCGFRVHDTMIYAKTNFGHPERARYHQLFEYVFILSKGQPRCFNPIKDKPNTWAGTGSWSNSVREPRVDVRATRNLISEFGCVETSDRRTVDRRPACKGSIHRPGSLNGWRAT